MRFFSFIVLALSLFSCNESVDNFVQTPSGDTLVKTIKPKYAKGFIIEQYQHSNRIIQFNPSKLSDTIAIYRTGKIKHSNEINIGSDISKIITLASPYIGVLLILNSKDKIKGVNQLSDVYNAEIREKIKQDDVKTFGEYSGINTELVLSENVDLIITSSYGEAERNEVIETNIPVIKATEWVENHPLGRAEWIKFFGFLLGKETEATTYFESIENQYLKSISNEKVDISLFCGNDFKGVWYMPGGKSNVAQLLSDAGIDYFYKNNEEVGSVSLSFENVVEKYLDAEIWLNPGPFTSLEEIKTSDKRYTNFEAFKNKKVYNYTAQVRDDGANNFWEIGVFEPHIVLNDFKTIFNGTQDSLVYYKKLE
jgi:iron complex transport system substrate-binding protein